MQSDRFLTASVVLSPGDEQVAQAMTELWESPAMQQVTSHFTKDSPANMLEYVNFLLLMGQYTALVVALDKVSAPRRLYHAYQQLRMFIKATVASWLSRCHRSINEHCLTDLVQQTITNYI